MAAGSGSAIRRRSRAAPYSLIPLLIASAVLPARSASPPTSAPSKRHLPRGFVSKVVKLQSGAERRYALYIPPQYFSHDDPNHRWPVIVFLHGSGECGGDGIAQTTFGLPVYIARHATRFPFITIMPQAQNVWFRGEEAEAVWTALEQVLREYRCDPDRIYLTGLSMGGFAAWEMSVMRPDVFAAIVPVCGVGPKEYMSNIVNLPVWAFHGAKDANVPVAGSREPIAELRRLGATPKYTEYPELSHICWDRAYATPELYPWLLQHRRKPSPRVIDYMFPGGGSHVWWLGIVTEKDAKSPTHVHAEIDDAGKITITSEGVAAIAVRSSEPPLLPGQSVEIVWNGKSIYKGQFSGSFDWPPPPTSAQAGASSKPSLGS